MRISKRNLAIEQAINPAHSAGRPQLETIHFEREGSVSADGFRLAFVPYPEPCAADDPAIGTMVPIDVARRAASIARWCDRIELVRDGKDFAIVIGSPEDQEDEAWPSAAAARIGGPAVEAVQFPSWGSIVPDPAKVVADVAVNPRYLIDALQQLDDAGAHSVRLQLQADASQPMRIEAVFGDEKEPEPTFFVLMPMRVGRRRGLKVVDGGAVNV